MRLAKMLAATVTATAAVVFGLPGIAQAYSSRCTVNGWFNPPFNSCTTDAVEAHANHWLDVWVDPYSGCTADFYIWDARNQEVIYRATVGPNFSTRHYRVYSFYHLKATFRPWRCGGEAQLDNDP